MVAATAAVPPKQGTFTALHDPNFRTYFIGQLISTVGTWMQIIAQAALVFQLTNSPLWSGIVACVAGLPLILFSPITGVIVERFPRKRLMLVTQTVQMLLAFTLTLLVITSVLQIWHIVVLAFLLGCTNAIDQPARLTLIPEIVGREQLQSGIQLTSILNSVSRALGPTLAGVALVTLGAAWCFFLNGLSFIAVILSLLLIRVPHANTQRSESSPLQQLREGLAYALKNEVIAPLLLLTVGVGLFGISVIQLFAAFAGQALGSSDSAYAAITAGQGAGSIIAGLLAGRLATRFGRGRIIAVTLALNAIAVILLSLQRQVIPATLMSMAFGLFGISLIIAMNITIQNIVPDEFRGRVLALYALAFFGLTPFGSLALGALGNVIGTPNAVLIAGIAGGVLGGLVFWRWPHLLQLE